jgi:CheY-like chemotaxis protein
VIDEILLASRLDIVKARDVDEEVQLLTLATEECSRYEEAELEGEPVTVRGDSPLLRLLRSSVITARGSSATSARRTLDVVDDADLIVTDYKMPDEDGVWPLRHVRGLGKTVPVLVLTGFAAVQVPLLAAAGFARVMLKPIDPGNSSRR